MHPARLACRHRVGAYRGGLWRHLTQMRKANDAVSMASVRDTRPKPRLFKSLGSFDELLEGPRQPVELPERRLNKTAALATLQSLPRAISDGMLPLSSVKNIYVSLPVTKADLATTTAIRVPPIGQVSRNTSAACAQSVT